MLAARRTIVSRRRLSMQMKIVCKNRFASPASPAYSAGHGRAEARWITRRCCATRACASPSRAAIILEILHAAEGHPDAAQIFERAVARDSRISLATVYRTMRALEESRRHPAPRLRRRPGALRAGARRHHDHLIDLDTGEVIEFASHAHRGAAGGDRRAARLRDRAPPARALRPQAQGGVTPRRTARARARRGSPSARTAAAPARPSTRVKRGAARALAAQRRAQSSGVDRQRRRAAARAAGAPGERRTGGARPSASASPSGRCSGSGVVTASERRARRRRSVSRSTSLPSAPRDRGRAGADRRRGAVEPPVAEARSGAGRAAGRRGARQRASRIATSVCFTEVLLSMIAARVHRLLHRCSPMLPPRGSNGRRGEVGNGRAPQQSEGRSSVPHARGHP